MLKFLKWLIKFIFWLVIAGAINKILFYDLAKGEESLSITSNFKDNFLPFIILALSAVSSLWISFSKSFWIKVKFLTIPFLYFAGIWFINKFILIFNLLFSFDMGLINNNEISFTVFFIVYVFYVVFGPISVLLYEDGFYSCGSFPEK